MLIPLNTFENYIDETILSRGLSYFKNGHVQEPDLLGQGEYEFIVKGTQYYTVRLSLKNDTITEYVCNCPYDLGPVCKHIAAAIFLLQQDELDIRLNADLPKNKQRKKKKTIADQVNELLENASHEELKRFIRERTKQDRMFRNYFLASFFHLGNNESKEMYAQQVMTILQAASDRYGFIDWSAVQFVNRAVQQLLQSAQKQVKIKNHQSAFFISTAVMEQMTEALQFADDNDGDISACIDSGFEILVQLAEADHDEVLRKQIIEYCFTAFEKEIYKEWDWHMGMLEIAAFLVKSEEEIKHIFELLDRDQYPEYEQETVQHIKYDILNRTRGEEEADKYLEQHINNPNLRREAIQKALGLKDFDKANKLAQDGVKYDRKDKPGLALEWHDWLLKVALAQGNTEKIIEFARYLHIYNYRNVQDYYQILKEHVRHENWKEFLEKVIVDIRKKEHWPDNSRIAQIYINEKWWDRLMEMVKKDPGLNKIEHYETYLAEDYADEIVDLYANEIMTYMEHSMGREHYQSVCRYLRRMIKLGGREKATRTISLLREKYPQRRALLEELNNV